MSEQELPRAMNARDDGAVVGYMCLTDWECELGAASDGSKVYPSIKALKREHTCWRACGTVEVSVRVVCVVAKGRSR